MKKMILAIAVATSILSVSSQANAREEHTVTLQNGQEVTLSLDYCVDPVTKHIGPCLFEVQQAGQNDNDACWDPVTKRYEPCL